MNRTLVNIPSLKRRLTLLFPIILLVLLTLVFAVMTKGRFIKNANLEIMLTQSLLTGTIATGAVFIFSSGNMNMAMGATTAIACICGGYAYQATNSALAMFLACVGGGVLILGIACLLSQVFNIKVLTTTLIMMQMLQSLQNWLVGSNQIKLDFTAMSQIKNSGILLVMAAVFFAVCFVLFQLTKMGRVLKFIGENKDCARQTGLNEHRMVILGFLVTAVAIGIGAFIYITRNAAVTSYSCNGMNQDIMLAIVLGGTPISGGTKSKIYSGFVGALTVTAISNGLLMLRVDALWIQAIRGLFFIAIIALSQKRPQDLPVRSMFN